MKLRHDRMRKVSPSNPSACRPTMGAFVIACLLVAAICPAQSLHTRLMQSTFLFVGSGSMGTVFVLAVPSHDHPDVAYKVMVTAAHVLDSSTGDYGNLVMRRPQSDGTFDTAWTRIRIRENGRPLWTRHTDPGIDVAAMLAPLPSEMDWDYVPVGFLATEEELIRDDIRPGDDLCVLGYPLGFSSPLGCFPVLRSGRIASYPLTPVDVVRTFYLDFEVFPGNSGGPVYIWEQGRSVGDTHYLDKTVAHVLGLVSNSRELEERFKGVFEATTRTYPLQLGDVVPSPFIHETIELLHLP